jgi:hypothetical protein
MITDLDETIKQILIKKAGLEPSEVDITFDTPNREWSASVSKPTVNLYLYDIRENHDLRITDWDVEQNGNGTATRKKTASRVNLSYLVTVWSNNIEDQHRLLWRVMATLFQYPTIPQELLAGNLAKQDYPVDTFTAQPDGLFNNPADFWAALDNDIKPSINYVVTVPLDLNIAFTSPIVSTAALEVKTPGTETEKLLQLTGIVHAAGKPAQVIPNATVISKETGHVARTDAEGKYYFPHISAGKHTFQVLVSGRKPKEVVITVPSIDYNLEV